MDYIKEALQTIQNKDMDYKMAKLAHNKLTEQLASKIMESGNTDLLIMSAGPYRHHSCMSAYCVDAQEMADAVGMICWGIDERKLSSYCGMTITML